MNKNTFKTSRAMAAGVIAGALAALVMSFAFAPAPANAEDPPEIKEAFQARYESALIAVANAKARVVASEKALRKARQRDRLKGESRVEIYAEIDAAKIELEAAEAVLATIPEDARQAGVPPGWLREVEERQAGES